MIRFHCLLPLYIYMMKCAYSIAHALTAIVTHALHITRVCSRLSLNTRGCTADIHVRMCEQTLILYGPHRRRRRRRTCKQGSIGLGKSACLRACVRSFVRHRAPDRSDKCAAPNFSHVCRELDSKIIIHNKSSDTLRYIYLHLIYYLNR